ncbi:MAG: hypothetical protein WC804_13315 [Sphingomonas sp.]|jgi:hypothetical protein|uniref:hypothetical protein n=1 Tax=Sphingomonas sp. TaxID=28214 RepID=UPI0035619F95
MSERPAKAGFASRPGDADRWIKAADVVGSGKVGAVAGFTARLTIDVTPALRQRMKLVAVQRGTTVADMARALFEREFPDISGED